MQQLNWDADILKAFPDWIADVMASHQAIAYDRSNCRWKSHFASDIWCLARY